MRTVGLALKARMALKEASLCRLMRLTRKDGVVHQLSSLGSNVTITGLGTFLGDPGFDITTYKFRSDGTPSTGEAIIPVLSSENFTPEMVTSGIFDGAALQIYVCDYLSTADGVMTEFSGYVGSFRFTDAGDANFEFTGLLSRIGDVVLETFGPNCSANLGDSRCRVPLVPAVVEREADYVAIATPRGNIVKVLQGGSYNNRIYECTTAGTTATVQPTFTTTVGATTTDGTAVFTCRQAWMRFATVASVIDRSKFSITIDEARAIDGWFDNGALRFETGANAALPFDIRKWTQTGTKVELWQKTPHDIAVGATLYIHPGCDKTLDQTNGCVKFQNYWFFQGFQKIPLEDFKFSYGA